MYDISYHLNNEDVGQGKEKCNNETHSSRDGGKGNDKTETRCYDDDKTWQIVLIDVLADLTFQRNFKSNDSPIHFQLGMLPFHGA